MPDTVEHHKFKLKGLPENRKLFRPFRWIYWMFYLSYGWLVHLLSYLISRNVRIVTDVASMLRSFVFLKGSTLSRLHFFLTSRVFSPEAFWRSLKNVTTRSEELPEDWDSLRKSVLKRDRHQCTVCNASETRLDVDHIIPRQWGGKNHKDNLRTLCWACHRVRHFRHF